MILSEDKETSSTVWSWDELQWACSAPEKSLCHVKSWTQELESWLGSSTSLHVEKIRVRL